jgi:hypothetical protein
MAENKETNSTDPREKEITPEFAYRALNTFKDDSEVDIKELSKTYGKNPQWWAS